ncbi:MAG TPA: hypothetical protein VHM00_09270 [Caldimonas sp.]|jgi:hypothetical protein|nr:hypothetical protein [Caldimonas sp.]HEX2541257.1 hypothetical protein [Caldimonas sp.]
MQVAGAGIMRKQVPGSGEAPREGPVERSRRLRLDARAMLEAAQRSMEATQSSYGLILNRRVDPDRRKLPREAPALSRREEGSVEQLFHGFLDTQPLVRWDDEQPGGDTPGPEAHGSDAASRRHGAPG